ARPAAELRSTMKPWGCQACLLHFSVLLSSRQQRRGTVENGSGDAREESGVGRGTVRRARRASTPGPLYRPSSPGRALTFIVTSATAATAGPAAAALTPTGAPPVRRRGRPGGS